MRQETDVLVIGAGQAGLAVGHYLKKEQANFLIIDRGDAIGHIWRNRYDSLVLFTPRWYSSLPGLRMEGAQDGYAGKEEVADYLQRYAIRFELPVQLRTELIALTRAESGFEAHTSRGVIAAKQVIVATGPFQEAFVPSRLSNAFSLAVPQIHTSEYKNASQLKEGSVLVVGAGNSGAQIAVELAQDREVYLSIGHPLKFFPMEIMGKSIFWWFKKLGVLNVNGSSKIGRWLRGQKDPIFGKELLSMIEKNRVKLKPKTVAVQSDVITFADNSRLKADNILWATGYYSAFSWLQIPEAKDRSGMLLHTRGVSPVAGLYCIGQAWQNTRGSALLGGVGNDAKYIISTVLGDSNRAVSIVRNPELDKVGM